jgi:hypothetical protein
MDAKTLAAEMKAKAAVAMKEAEEMERLAELAEKNGWHVDLKPAIISSVEVETEKPSRTAITPKLVKIKKGGKQVDPNSVTSRSKSESVKIITALNRPVPLGELGERLAAVGVRLGGKKPNQALSANLGMCPELVSTKRGWWLAGYRMPPEDKSSAIGRTEGLPGLN